MLNDQQLKEMNESDPQASGDAEIKRLLEENMEMTKDIRDMTKKIRRFVLWQQIFGVIKILIIVIPIVLGIMYTQQLIDEYKTDPNGFLNNSWLGTVFDGFVNSATQRIEANPPEIDADNIPAEYQKYLQ